MVKKLEWYTDGQDKTSVKGAVDGLRLFRAYQGVGPSTPESGNGLVSG